MCLGECPFLGCWFGGDDAFFQIRVVDWSSANVDPLSVRDKVEQ